MKTLIALAVLALTGFVPSANSQNMLGRANAVNAQWRAEQGYAPAGYYNGGYYNTYGRRPSIAAAVVGGLIGGAVVASYRGHNQPLAGPSNVRNGNNGEFVLTNTTRFSIEVYFGKGKGKHIGRLASGTSLNVKGPKPGERYSGFALIPNTNGGLSSDEVPIQPTQNGWVFVEPDCSRQEGGR
jgi:hypothetical protein